MANTASRLIRKWRNAAVFLDGTGLPSWLHVSSTGQLSGTPPAGSSGGYTFTLNVQDTNSQSTAITVTLQVNAAALAIVTTSPLTDAKEGSAYAVSFQGIGGKSPYSWSAAGLPAFLGLTASGSLSGKPPAGSAGTYSFTVTVTDASGSKTSGVFSIKVDSLLSITVTPPVLEATEGQPYSVTFGVSGGTSPYVWSAMGLPQLGESLTGRRAHWNAAARLSGRCSIHGHGERCGR